MTSPLPGTDQTDTAGPAGPRVLLVVPTLGRRLAYLRETLTSIADQRSEPADVIVVAPAAAAEARSLAEESGALVVDDPGSMSAAINYGLSLAKPHHTYANWIGDDDLLAPDSLAVAAAALDANDGSVAAFGQCRYIDEHGRSLFVSRAGRFAPWLMTWGPDLVPQPGALFRLATVRAVGGLDVSLRYAMDLDLLLRLRQQGRLVNTGQVLASFRWHPDSATVSDRTASLDEAQSVKRRYLGAFGRTTAHVWERPVRLATRVAVLGVNRRSRIAG